jgi:hypothetical protein
VTTLGIPESSGQETAYTSGVGRRPMKFKPMPFGTRIPVPLQKRVRQHAAESGCSINDVVETALEEHLRRVRLTTPVARPTVLRKKGPKGGR